MALPDAHRALRAARRAVRRGQWRGGIGMVRVNRFLVDTIVTCEGDRYESDPPWGIFGGEDGTLAHGTVTTPDGDHRALACEVHGQGHESRLHHRDRRPDSGGYGNPLERDPNLVRSDVLDGFTRSSSPSEAMGS